MDHAANGEFEIAFLGGLVAVRGPSGRRAPIERFRTGSAFKFQSYLAQNYDPYTRYSISWVL